jgi:HEPN domain-containing protein
MTKDEKFLYWLDAAKYDIETAEAMLLSGRWFYVVFMCQQAIEKLVKGLYNFYIDDNVPRVHNIQEICDKVSDRLPLKISDENYTLCKKLTSYYIAHSYPDFISKVGASVDKKTATDILHESKEFFIWLTDMKR